MKESLRSNLQHILYMGSLLKVCLLHNATRGLKQSSCAYFMKFSHRLTTNGFIPFMVDSIVTCKTTSRGTDILLIDNDENDILSTKAYLTNTL